MDYNWKKFINKRTGKAVILTAAGAKEVLSDKKMKTLMSFVGDCSEAGQLKPKEGDFIEPQNEGSLVKTETTSVEDILKGNPPVVDVRLMPDNSDLTPKNEEDKGEKPFSYDDKQDDFEEKSPE